MSWPRRVTEEQLNKADAERLRDTFAAAALTGLMANSRHDKDTTEEICRWSWNWADAMLRERSRTGQAAAGTTPQSRAGTNASKAEIDALEFVVEEGRTASVDDYGILRSWLIRLRPEWESQSYEESNEKRANANTNRDATPSEGSVQGEFTDTVFKTLVERISLTQSLLDENERLREAIRRLADQDATLSVQGGNVTVTLDATLTDAEREAIAQTIDAAIGMASAEPWTISTLRSLLERMK